MGPILRRVTSHSYSYTHMIRFIILGEHRVGSNLLVTLLDSHPDCRTRPEILNNIYPLSRYKKLLRRRLPLLYFRKEAWGDARGKKAVGTKVFYQQFQSSPSVMGAVGKDDSIHIIHLTRENLLRQFLSLTMAKTTKKWSHLEGYEWKGKLIPTEEKPHSQPQEPIELPVEKLTQFLNRSITRQAKFRTLFTKHPTLEVTYEELTGQRDSTLNRIQNFVGLDCKPLSSPFQKQITRSLSEMITNYAELKVHFQGTEWDRFFDE